MENVIESAAGVFGEGRLDVSRLRPYINAKGQPVYAVNNKEMRANAALLRYDEWKDIDTTVTKIAADRLVAVRDLIAGGLTHNLGSIGITVSQFERESDMTPADFSMSGVTAGSEDTPAYALDSVPVPVVHKDFRVNIRRLEASRRLGESIDTAAAAIASRKVAEGSEDMLFSGKPIVVDGGTIYGYTNFPFRSEVDMADDWADAATTGDDIVQDVTAMVQKMHDNRRTGPYKLYVPTAYWGKFQEDYSEAYPRTIQSRVEAIDGVGSIAFSDRLTTGNVLLVELSRETVDLAIAQDVTTLSWSDNPMVERFKVMAVWVPRLKRDFNGSTGVVHLHAIPSV